MEFQKPRKSAHMQYPDFQSDPKTGQLNLSVSAESAASQGAPEDIAKSTSRVSRCFSIYYRLSSLLFLAALVAAIYFTWRGREQLAALHSEAVQLSEEAIFPRIYVLVLYFATGFLTIYILISFWIFWLSAEENRDLISLSLIMMMCQRSVLLPPVIYLAYQAVSEALILHDEHASYKDLNREMFYLSVAYLCFLGQVALELFVTSVMMTCIYVCKRGTKTIGHDKLTLDQKSESIYYELSNEDMIRGTVDIKKRVRHYGEPNQVDFLRQALLNEEDRSPYNDVHNSGRPGRAYHDSLGNQQYYG